MSKYNLITEPWITVLKENGKTTDISISEALKNGKDYAGLAGENRLQDISILRMLSALAVTIMYRYDSNGNRRDLRNVDELFDLYGSAYKNGLPHKMIDAYLNEWEDRFFLFDDKHPFMQVPEDKFILTEEPYAKHPSGHKVVTKCGVDKEGAPIISAVNYFQAKSWVGTILESGNTKSPFSNYANTDKLELTYAEAARWLVWFLSFAPCSSKNPGKYKSKMTWASCGALLSPRGENLHETIMLNSVLLNRNKLYKEVSPIWERETTDGCECAPYGENGYPSNLPELYTQQSRKLRLHETNGAVKGMFVVPGDYYSTEDAFAEPMFMWFEKKGKPGEPDKSIPQKRSPSAPIWKELAHIIPSETKTKAGVTEWIYDLYANDILNDEKTNIPYSVTGVFYGKMKSVLEKSVEDDILIDKKYYDPDISMEFEDTLLLINKISNAVYTLSKSIALSMGISQDRADPKARKRSTKYEEKIGTETLQCLGGYIDIQDLQKKAFSYAEAIADELIEDAPVSAFLGHNGHNIASAERKFKTTLNRLRKAVCDE